MKQKLLLSIIAMILIVPSGLANTVYVTRDAKGNLVFSDRPSSKAERANLPPLTITAGSGSAAQPLPPGVAPTSATYPPALKPTLGFTNVTNEQTFQNVRDIPIEVKSDPKLSLNDWLVLYLDGKKRAEAEITNTDQLDTPFKFTLSNVDRGTHTIKVEWLNQQKNLIATTPDTTIYVHYASKLLPVSQ